MSSSREDATEKAGDISKARTSKNRREFQVAFAKWWFCVTKFKPQEYVIKQYKL